MAELYANNQTGIANSPQVTVIRPSGNLNLQCDNIVNPPDGEFIFTTYRDMTDPDSGEQVVDPSSIREMTGTSSTNIITITSFAPGNTDDGNQIGDHVVFRPGAHWANTVAKRLDPAGTFVTTQDKLAATVKDLTANRNWVLPNTGIITQNTGLIGSLSNIKYYIAGKSYEKTSIADKTYVATRDTYVFIDTAGTVTYSDVAVGGTAPTPPANSVLIGVVTTGASAITAISIKNHGSIASSDIDFTSLNYSTSEVDTGRKWIDGKTIYRRTFTGTTSITGNSRTQVNLMSGTGIISTLVDSFGAVSDNASWVQLGHSWINPTGGRYVGSSIMNSTSSATLQVISDTTLPTVPYKITLEYTKP